MKIEWPHKKEFTLKDLLQINKDFTKSRLVNIVKKQEECGRLKHVGFYRESSVGKCSKVYSFS